MMRMKTSKDLNAICHHTGIFRKYVTAAAFLELMLASTTPKVSLQWLRRKTTAESLNCPNSYFQLKVNFT